MNDLDRDANADFRLSELACLVDAIPGRFRAPVMRAALGILPAVDWQDAPLVQSLRSQIQDCVDDYVGFCIGEAAWHEADLSDLQSGCDALGGCRTLLEVEQAVRRMVSQLAQMIVATTRETQS